MASGERPEVAESDRVRLIHLDGAPTIGDARNVGCEHARGEVIAHWDDDDWSAPGRIADQVELLHRSGKAVVGYTTMRFTDGERWWLYRGPGGYALGTSLVYRRDWWLRNRFRSLQVGEDNHFVSCASKQDAIAVTDAGNMMYATIHQGNTSPRNLTAGNFTECTAL